MGVAIGKLLYQDGKRAFKLPDLSARKFVAWFSWLGRHSLPVYLAQMPVTLAGLGMAAS